ncbi:MAG TPA: hypothetical protein ENI87_10465 [bacterium]|nr:hypothetical protein [bacterium]
MLDEKIECTECHRVFFAKVTAGKRVQPPDNTRMYVGFGVAIVAIIAIFAISSQGSDTPVRKPGTASTPKQPVYGLGDHPRAAQLTQWAQSLASNNQLVLKSHSDLRALGQQIGEASTDPAAIMAALLAHESTELLRTMECRATLSSEADMTAEQGTGQIYVTPRAGDDRFKTNTNGIYRVTFKVHGTQVKVDSFRLTREPIYAPGKKPGIVTYRPNEDINKPEVVEISDSAGTRKVKESEPAPVPHYKGATPEQRALADEVTAGILAAAEPGADGRLFNRATLKVRSAEDKKAAIPRVLNAMYECYDDVVANHQRLILLDRALYQWTGYAVNYPSAPSGNTETDIKRRQSCIRQWFAFWYRYHEDLSEFFDDSENLEGEGDGGK